MLMPSFPCRILLLLCLFVGLAVPALAQDTHLAIDPKVCLECHGDVVSAEQFAASVHGQNACTSCHVEVTDIDKHESGDLMPGPVKCSRCHKKETAEHYASVHMLNDIGCSACHSDIHSHNYWKGDKRIAVAKCNECHSDVHDVYHESVHGKALQEGNMDSAACFDCHNLHEIKPLGDPASRENREFHSKVCMKCHADEEMMTRNGVMNVAVKTYMESYHGKNYRLGFPELVAGCADCHSSHEVLLPENPKSWISPEKLVDTCGKCHPKATSLFTKFYPHGEHNNREEYPILYYTYVSMTGLLAGTFAVFWIHTLLWMFRGFVENREKKAQLLSGEHHAIPGAHTIYRRFYPRHIFLHILVIVSFLGLSLTGLPLKFAEQTWARIMMDWYGGAPVAALIHRICAGITFVYFGAALVMSVHFLFVRKDLPGNWLQRLFGPDSLCPSLRDIRDVTAMVRWFFFLGPKPTFDRWTYWEKFDFLAVFWGMFAIGGSGLMLWFPEYFGGFLPGWMFNVATIVHSDEALLATGFIFTVHFFNTHGRPEKFPMDFVIFNGEMSKEEFIEERGDQWARYEQAGVTEQFRKARPSRVLYDFVVKGFGFIALFTGIGLLLLMLYAFLAGGHHI